MNTWTLPSNLFARRISIHDVPGFFSRSLEIEPGLRAVIIDEGRSLGEVPPGTYTLETFVSRLQNWWSRKQCDVIMARREEQVLRIVSVPVLTADYLLAEFHTEVTVRLDDLAIFLQNQLGNRTEYSLENLQQLLTPILSDLVSDWVRKFPLLDLRVSKAVSDLDAWLANNLTLILQRYGFVFGHVRTLSIVHPEFDAQMQRRGEVVLRKMAAENDRQAEQLDNEAAWDSVRGRDRSQQVRAALEALDLSRREGELGVMQRRVEIRSKLRDAVQSDEFDKLRTAAEREEFLRSVDRDRLIEEDELQQLRDILSENSADRAAARSQFIKRLAISQKLDLELLADECSHELASRRRKMELELVRFDEDEVDRQWKRDLEREAAQAEHARSERWKAWQHRVRKFRSYWQEKRADQIEEVLHESRRDQHFGDLEVQRAERANRMRIMELELQLRDRQFEAQARSIAETAEAEARKRTHQLELEFAREREALQNQQAHRRFELEERIRLGKLSEDQARAAMQQASLLAMQESQAKAAEHQHRLILEADRQRTEREENAREREHQRDMQRRVHEENVRANERRDNQAHETVITRLKNDRFRDAQGQTIDVLIFGAEDDHTRTSLVERAKADTKAQVAAAVAAQQQEAAAAALSRERELLEKLLQNQTNQPQSQPSQADAATQQLLVELLGRHITSLEAASDKRDASVQSVVQKLLDALAPHNTAATPNTTPHPQPPSHTTVVVNPPPQAGHTAPPFIPQIPRQPGANEKYCPYCHSIIPCHSRFCPECGRKQD